MPLRIFDVLRRSTAMAVLVLAVTSFSAVAQEDEFSGTFPNHDREIARALVGGYRAASKDWPATLVFKYRNSSGTIGRCTATVVGPRTVLTAAHCMEDGGNATITTLGGSTVKARCTHHPKYVEDYSQDFALCLTNSTLSGFKFERINTDASVPMLNAQVELLGFGCLQEQGVDESFGVLYQGPATVVGRPTTRINYVSTSGGAAVCFGDSGGGAYVIVNGQKLLFGVNSRGDISEISRLSATSDPVFLAFLDKWLTDNGAGSVCGRGANADLCRN